MPCRARVLLATATLTAACAPAVRPAADSAPPAGTGSASATPAGTASAAAGWPGTYDLLVIGATEGRNRGVMTVTPRDTGYAMTLQGPPGRGLSQRFVGDSVYAVWLLAEGDTLFTEMRVVGDSIHGRIRESTQPSGTQWQVIGGSRRR